MTNLKRMPGFMLFLVAVVVNLVVEYLFDDFGLALHDIIRCLVLSLLTFLLIAGLGRSMSKLTKE